jgi:hypothetical protein
MRFRIWGRVRYWKVVVVMVGNEMMFREGS